MSKLGIEWDRWEKYCLTSNRHATEIEHFRHEFKHFENLKKKIYLIKAANHYLNKSILEF